MSSDSSSSSESDDSRTQSSDSNGIREVNGNQPTHITFPEVPGFSNALDTYVYQNTAPGPRYRRGRGRSFFKDSPVGKNSCQVPGCVRPIDNMKEYYKRYKICPYHMEANFLLVEGQSIRFCQQCGRFQLLSEFDGDKRSCRKRLARHNSRRRKSEAEGGRVPQQDQVPSRSNHEQGTPVPSQKTAHELINSALQNVLEAMRVDGLHETPDAAVVKVRSLVALMELQQALQELSRNRSRLKSQESPSRHSLPPEMLQHAMSRLLQQRQVPVLQTSAMGPQMQQLNMPGAITSPPIDPLAMGSQMNPQLAMRQNFSPMNPTQVMPPQQAAMPQGLTPHIPSHGGDSRQDILPQNGAQSSEPTPDKLSILLETLKQASKK